MKLVAKNGVVVVDNLDDLANHLNQYAKKKTNNVNQKTI
jgi:hypothetical protein